MELVTAICVVTHIEWVQHTFLMLNGPKKTGEKG